MTRIERLRPGAHLSGATRHAGVVFLSGLVANDRNATFEEQTRQIFARADDMLAEAGSGRDLLLSATVYLIDQSEKDLFNRLWLEWLGQDLPARTSVGVANLGTPTTLIEITLVAASK